MFSIVNRSEAIVLLAVAIIAFFAFGFGVMAFRAVTLYDAAAYSIVMGLSLLVMAPASIALLALLRGK